MEYANITVETRENLGIITLNRPQALNAVNAEMLKELALAAEAFDNNDAVRVLIVKGDGKTFAAGIDIKEVLSRGLELVGSLFGSHHLFDLADETSADGLLTEVDTETMFCVILEQGVCPSRTSAGIAVNGIRRCRSGAAPNGGTAGSVGNVHSFAEELCDQSCIRGFGTACARTGEFK